MSVNYNPQVPTEKVYYDLLWTTANPSKALELGVTAALTFFQLSGIKMRILKKILSLSAPHSTMNLPQFYTAVRLIAMLQKNIKLSKGVKKIS
jgi:hypothetical protein